MTFEQAVTVAAFFLGGGFALGCYFLALGVDAVADTWASVRRDELRARVGR